MNETLQQESIVKISHLRTWFPIRRGLLSRTVGHVKAVNDVSLTVGKGETLGLVGESGCGKTTLGRTVVGLEPATDGQVYFQDQDLLTLPPRKLRRTRKHIQMIFQDPLSSLNPRMTVLDILTEGMVEHNLLQGKREDAAARLLGDVGLNIDSLHRYPHEFSGGQRQRLSIARALSLNPEFIICDEAVSALDVSVQAQVINLLIDLRSKYNLSYLFIAHDLSVVKLISHRVAVMYLGKIVETGDANAVITKPLHPYSKALVSAIPVPGADRKKRIILKGEIPSPANPPSGCPFHTRCPYVMDICPREWPVERDVEGRKVCCHLY